MRLWILILFLWLPRNSSALIDSIADVQDFHAPLFITDASVTNLVPFILSKTNDGVFNFKMFISAGDVFEQDTNLVQGGMWPIASMQAAMTQLKTNGVMTVLVNGNHDCDSTNSGCSYCNVIVNDTNLLWNNVFPITFFNTQPGYVTNRAAGDSHNPVMAWTNADNTVRLLFIGYKTLDNCTDPQTAYLAQTQWATNQARLRPDHNVIVVGHFFLNSYRELGYTDGPNRFLGVVNQNIGPGLEPFLHGWLNVPNLLAFIGGHDRRGRKMHRWVQADDGHLVDVVLFNTQGTTNNGGWVNVMTIDSMAQTMRFRTWDIPAARFLNNNDPSLPGAIGDYQDHDWTTDLIGTRRFARIQ